MKKKILLIAIIAATMVGLLSSSGAIYATDTSSDSGTEGEVGATGEDPSSSDFCQNVKNKGTAAYNTLCGGAKGEDDAEEVVKNVLNTVFTWTGIIAVIVIIIGGVLYMTSQGDPGKIARAKNAIMFAVIGLIVTLLAFAIVNFVLNAVQGA
jgi:hypothetical protein